MSQLRCLKTDSTPLCRHKNTQSPQLNRRGLLPGLVALSLLGSSTAARARQEPINKEVDAATSPYIQDLLAKTAAKKEQRYKERLNDYYKRNFKDYFEFEAGSIRTGRARGISEESQQAILKWLEENSDETLPKAVKR